jgi:hypothetical protein
MNNWKSWLRFDSMDDSGLGGSDEITGIACFRVYSRILEIRELACYKEVMKKEHRYILECRGGLVLISGDNEDAGAERARRWSSEPCGEIFRLLEDWRVSISNTGKMPGR